MRLDTDSSAPNNQPTASQLLEAPGYLSLTTPPVTKTLTNLSGRFPPAIVRASLEVLDQISQCGSSCLLQYMESV